MNKKKTVIITVMLVVMSIMAIGYSYFATRLNINATGSIDSAWNVYFSKIEVGTKSSGASTKSTPSVSATTANMDVSLKSPGDYINFNITLVNGGSVDAIIEDIEATAEGTPAIIFSISGIKIGDKLAGGSNASKVITIKMEYDSSTTSQPTELTKRLTVNIDVVQDIGQSITQTDPSITQPLLLSSQILKNSEAKSDANIDFSKSSSQDGTKGLYYTSTNTEGNKTTYYFRGPVENNYVGIGTEEVEVPVEVCNYWYDYVTVSGDIASAMVTTLEECEAALALEDDPAEGFEEWAACFEECYDSGETTTVERPSLWRIVRINEDGSIRLIKQDYIDFATYLSGKWGDNAYVGYMYGTTGATGENAYTLTHTNTTDSDVKTTLDAWYDENLSDYSSIIADAGFCNDRSVATGPGIWSNDDVEFFYDTALGYGKNVTFYGPYNRLINTKQPQFACPNASNDLFTLKGSSKGNKALTNPIGLITSDELVYSGYTSLGTTNSYLSSVVEEVFASGYITMAITMSPGAFTTIDNVASPLFFDGSLGYVDGMIDGSLVVPVINLIKDVKITGGNGTSTNPYVIKTN